MSNLSEPSDINKNISDIDKVMSENIEKIIEIEKKYVVEIQEYFILITYQCVTEAVNRICEESKRVEKYIEMLPKDSVVVSKYKRSFDNMCSEIKVILADVNSKYKDNSIKQRFELLGEFLKCFYKLEEFVNEVLNYVKACEDGSFSPEYKESLKCCCEKCFKVLFTESLDISIVNYKEAIANFEEYIRNTEKSNMQRDVINVNNILKSIIEIQNNEIFVYQILNMLKCSAVMRVYPPTMPCKEDDMYHWYMRANYDFIYLYYTTECIDNSYFSKVITFAKGVNDCLIEMCENFLRYPHKPQIFDNIRVSWTMKEEKENVNELPIIDCALQAFKETAEILCLQDGTTLKDFFLSNSVKEHISKFRSILKSMESMKMEFYGNQLFCSVNAQTQITFFPMTSNCMPEFPVYKFAKSMKLYFHNVLRFLECSKCIFSTNEYDPIVRIDRTIKQKKLDDIKYTLAK